MTVPIERIIKAAVDRGASDIHIKAGDLFRARIGGRLVPLTKQRLTPAQTRAIAVKLLPADFDRARLDRLTDFACSWGLAGVGRFRVSVLRQRSSIMVVMRVIPFTMPSLAELGLPDGVAELAEARSGLLLVTGPSGSGKSTTIAAMLHHLNQTVDRHVVTLEDPIEFLHRDLKCSITQREIGIDTESMAVALRAALRQDPDVVVVEELRDGETLGTMLKAAETGKLAIGVLNARDAPAGVAQLLALVPREDREGVRLRVIEALQGVVAQILVPRASGEGRVVAVELLVPTPAVRECLRDPSRAGELRSVMAKDAERSGMQTLEQHLSQLVKAGSVSADAARAATRRAETSVPAAAKAKR
jgi:twitching motility protein PilT